MLNLHYQVVRKGILASITALLLFSGVSLTAASYINPYSHVKTVTMSPAEEAAYIDQKTTEIFNPTTPSTSPASTAYVAPQGWMQEKLQFANVPVEKYTNPAGDAARIVLFLHGGGYVGGLHNRYRDWGIHQAELAGSGTLLAVDYRLAPEHAYPAALDDAVTTYTGLVAVGYDPAKMILVSDSAGGNLALALSLYLWDHYLPLPKAMVLISPWADMGNDLPSRSLNLENDKILGVKNRRLDPEIAQPTYAKGTAVDTPYLSPIYADTKGLPPILITAGGNELFLDDTALFAAHAKAAGVPCPVYNLSGHVPRLDDSLAGITRIEGDGRRNHGLCESTIPINSMYIPK